MKKAEKYIQKRNYVKRNVAKAKEKAFEELYDKLETKDGERELYRMARRRQGGKG